jgi:protein-tyrosine kinase
MMDNNKIVSGINPKSPVAEAFRILRTNLQFSTVDKPFKSILITSAGPGEGKSTTAANLGTVMAQTGAKVILVDCDLRRAELHRLFNLPNDEGLTNVLVGGLDIKLVLRDTWLPNLKVITSGPLPPNPAELLGSEKTREVLAKLKEMADIILVDSPPVLMVADATLLSSIVDGVILVIKSAKTKIDAAKQAKERLENANARIVGTVLNAVESSNGYYYYYNSSYYGDKGKKEAAAAKG